MIVLKRWMALVVALAVLGVAQFCVLTAYAMTHYRSPSGEAYSSTEQFLSYLGEEDSNVQFTFNSALIFLGVCLVPFFAMLPSIDRRDTSAMKFAALAGFVSAIGLIGVGGTPLDEDPHFHNMMLALWIVPTPIMIVCFYAAAMRSKFASKWFIGFSVLLALTTAIYPISYPPENPVVLQKVAVCFVIGWFCLIGWFVFRSAYFIVLPSEEQFQRTQEDDYFKRVAARHRTKRNPNS